MSQALDEMSRHPPIDQKRRDDESVYVEELHRSFPVSHVRLIISAFSRKMGGLTKLTPEQRQKRASKAAQVRWGTKKKK